MSNIFNYEDAKNSNSLINHEKLVTATTDAESSLTTKNEYEDKVFKTDEDVFSRFIKTKGEKYTYVINDTVEEVIRDAIIKDSADFAVLIVEYKYLFFKGQDIIESLLHCKRFITRACYLNDEGNIVWIVQVTNDLGKSHWVGAMYSYIKSYAGKAQFVYRNSNIAPARDTHLYYNPVRYIEYIKYLKD